MGESYDGIRALADLIRIIKIPNIALMLQSCLGGSAPGFHIKFQRDRHFHFLVSCKSVGFKVYNLRRFVGACFDVYFHLWSNGAPHWEREKFLWEQEQEREWITVNSCRNKKPSQATPRTRCVCFAPKLVQSPPVRKHQPLKVSDSVMIGAFTIPIAADFDNEFQRFCLNQHGCSSS